MEYPKITIITPSYNQGGYIEETITSILDQKYPNLEYIIIDGGSTDNTVDIIKSYEDQITYWVSESDRGQSHAINKGLEIATGDLVNWINSDDYLEKDALWNLAKAFKDNPDGEVFCGYTHCFWDESGDTSHTYRMGVQPTATATILNIEMNQPGTFFKKPILDSIGSINESLRYVFDNELWMRFLCKYGQNNIVLLDSLFAHFRQHDQSKSIGEGFEEFGKEQQNIIQWLNKQTDLVDFLQDKINEKTVNSNYKSEPWDFSYLDVEYLHAFSADKYMVTLLNEGQKKQAKYCLQKSMKNKIFKLNKKNLGLIKQLFIG
ncbi:glycosyltransferase family 2 protein [Winogradskyella undariae]|uniref:glycosyltransferase family 2 protein n=1 Tax=Winogradskyella undariae TaxID=1285465 RepID=UPI0015C73BD0|nr:glycosyltransferase family 2 protein [Winogradskyella undariae]